MLAVAALLVSTMGCAKALPLKVQAAQAPDLVPRQVVLQDTSHKEAPRMVPPEVYMRTYLTLFGGLSPLDAQKKAKGGDGNNLFDSWNDYIASLGFPDYHVDIPRQMQPNALMVATFERLGVALCDRAVEHDLRGKTPVPVSSRVIFAFELPAPPAHALTEAEFQPRYDVLHRTFLGYPARLGPDARSRRFYALYTDVVKAQADAVKGGQKLRFTAEEEGWASVCYALVRHPEFHLY
jgi:hypothetical protein